MVRAEGCLRRVPYALWETAWHGCQGSRESGAGLVPGAGWPGSQSCVTRGITMSTSTAGSCVICQARRRAAVDVGCGTGVLAGKLAGHFACVTGIDADAGMAAAASARLDDDPGVIIRRCGFEESGTAACDGEADLIAMVAVLHRLDLHDTLARIPGLLAPGGRLLVVGLRPRELAARPGGRPRLGLAANPVMGRIQASPPRPPG